MDIDLPGLGRFTTEHATSSYGIPVLLIDGEAYGPGDNIPAEGGVYESIPALNAFLQWQEKQHQSGASGCQQITEEVETDDGYRRGTVSQTRWLHSEECQRVTDAYRAWSSAVPPAPWRPFRPESRQVHGEASRSMTVKIPVDMHAALNYAAACASRLAGKPVGISETVRGLLAYALDHFGTSEAVAQYLLKGQEDGGEAAGK